MRLVSAGMETGAIIRRARTSRGMSQVAFAVFVGVSPGTVSKWERNAAKPSVPSLRSVAERLGLSVESMLGDESARSVSTTESAESVTEKAS